MNLLADRHQAFVFQYLDGAATTLAAAVAATAAKLPTTGLLSHTRPFPMQLSRTAMPGRAETVKSLEPTPVTGPRIVV